MMTTADGPKPNLDRVLTLIGRASTPPVPETPFGISRGALMDLPATHADTRVVSVAEPVLTRRLQERIPTRAGVPGLLTEQVSLPEVSTLVIDWAAFAGGPWLGANTHSASSLIEEIFEAGRIMRATGRLVLGLPLRPLTATGDARLMSTCTVDMTAVPADDLQEGAPLTEAWTIVAHHARDRGNFVSPAKKDS